MTTELFESLKLFTLILSAVLISVWVLRPLWLRCFGANTTMLLWLSVPGTLLAALLPAPTMHINASAAAPPTFESTLPLQPAVEALSIPVTAATNYVAILVSVWMVGVMLAAAFLILAQWQYRRLLGRLEPLPDGSYRSQSPHIGPALVGGLRPRIVVPSDFEQRFSPEQQSLILAHERCHLRRGDAQLSLLACILRCLFWFNPLVHIAWNQFKADQELACDAAVLRNHAHQKNLYAEAMLLTRFDSVPLPVGCTWPTSSPLKRRITMLYASPKNHLILLVGMFVTLSISATAAFAAWSSQEPEYKMLEPIALESKAKAKLTTNHSVEMPLQVAGGTAQMAQPTSDPSHQTEIVKSGEPSAHKPTQQPEIAPAPLGSLVEYSAPERQATVSKQTAMPDSEQKPGAVTKQVSLAEAPAIAANFDPSPLKPEMPMQQVAKTAANGPVSEPAGVSKTASSTASESVRKSKIQPARLVASKRPSFPRTVFKPKLISYPGMPESDFSQSDLKPHGVVWQLEVGVEIDKNGNAANSYIQNNALSNKGFVRKYERIALSDVKDWKYEPARVNGKPVASDVRLSFYFYLDEPPVTPITDSWVGPHPTKISVKHKGY